MCVWLIVQKHLLNMNAQVAKFQYVWNHAMICIGKKRFWKK